MRIESYASVAPPPMVEYAYSAALVYSIIGPSIGLEVPYAASGMLLLIAVYCVIELRSRAIAAWATAVWAPMRLPLACVISYLVVQIVVHNEPIMTVRDFLNWLLTLIIVQSLCLRRGFLHRCAFVLFIIGLTVLPSLAFQGSGLEERAAAGSMVSGGFRNANGLGGWFGYCCIYFTIVGIETKRPWVRVAAWLTAVGCLYIVGLTVSRGALLATASGITTASRGLLKRGFVPLLLCIILGGIIFNLGIFDRVTSRYAARGAEDTGRMAVWPLAIERFLSSPLLGVGMSNTATRVPGRAKLIEPHNTFIFLALSSGVLPLVFFVAWWIRAARNAFSYNEQLADSPFRFPLLVCIFWMSLFGDFDFMSPWGVVTLCIAMAPNMPYGGSHLVARHVGRGQTFQALDTTAEAGPFIVHRRL
jgi:O-antigen ligase